MPPRPYRIRTGSGRFRPRRRRRAARRIRSSRRSASAGTPSPEPICAIPFSGTWGGHRRRPGWRRCLLRGHRRSSPPPPHLRRPPTTRLCEVPCLRRTVSVEEEYDTAGTEIVLDDDEVVLDDDVPPCEGWLATHGVQGSKPEEEEDMPSMDTLGTGKAEGIKSIPSYFGAGEKQEDEEDIPDMDTYEDTGDHSATTQPSYFVAEEPEDDNILHTRAYDVSITYDKYYQTPRV